MDGFAQYKRFVRSISRFEHSDNSDLLLFKTEIYNILSFWLQSFESRYGENKNIWDSGYVEVKALKGILDPKKSEKDKPYLQVLNSHILLSCISVFEMFLSNFLKETLGMNQHLLRAFEGEFKYKELLERSDEIEVMIINKVISKKLKGGYQNWTLFLSKYFHIGNLKDSLDNGSYELMESTWELRHILVHNAGYIDQSFIDSVNKKDTLISVDAVNDANTRFVIDSESVFKMVMNIDYQATFIHDKIKEKHEVLGFEEDFANLLSGIFKRIEELLSARG